MDIVSNAVDKGEKLMRIEDNYRDVVIYHVVFKVKDNRKISRTLILDMLENDIPKTSIEFIVLNTFKDVLEILAIDEVMDGLLLCEISQYQFS